MTSNFIGRRDESFKTFIHTLLKFSKLKKHYIDKLITNENLKLYSKAFTSKVMYAPGTTNLVPSKDNYEIFEFLGDATIGKFIVWYCFRRFPQLNCDFGVKILARLKISLGSTDSLSGIANDLGFWPFISAPIKRVEGVYSIEKFRKTHKWELLEDCFEAFIGCTEYILDKEFRQGVGNSVVYDMLKNIFNKIDISLKYEDIFDAKTRLKEIIELYKQQLGKAKYINVRDQEKNIWKSKVYVTNNNENNKKRWRFLGEAEGRLKVTAEKNASKIAISTLAKLRYKKELPNKYKKLCT